MIRPIPLLLVVVALLALLVVPAGAVTLDLGTVYFPGAPSGDHVGVGAALTQPLTTFTVGGKQWDVSADLLMLSTGKVAGAVGTKAHLSPAFAVELGYALGAYAPDFSKEAWRNLCIGALYSWNPSTVNPVGLESVVFRPVYQLRIGKLPTVSRDCYGAALTKRF